MYWLQFGLSLAAGVYLATLVSPRLAIPVFLLGYVGTRVLFATIYRTKYWLRRGSARFNRKRCPNCNRERRRLAGDWYLECRRCGWKVGLPVLRWLSHSVPAVQMRRSLTTVRAVLVILAVALLLSGATVTPNDIASNVPDLDSDSSDGPAADSGSQDGYDIDETEALVQNRVNDYREDHGKHRLGWDSRLSRSARAHAEDMAAKDYFSHRARDGQTPQQRYHCNAGENIAYTWAGRDVTQPDGSTEFIGSENDIANSTVSEWHHSPPHREIMRDSGYSKSGVGVAITDGGKVYIVMAYC